MKRKSLSQKILKISEGLVATAIDLCLIGVFLLKESSPVGAKITFKEFPAALQRDLENINYQTLKQAVKRTQSKGWIKRNLEITKKGRERLESIFPRYQKSLPWDGNWYIVSYDIPENMKTLREILRRNLKKIGFGQVHQSFWIYPYNFLGEIEKIVQKYNLQINVILAISDKVGREPSKILANRIWNLEKINDKYQEFLHKLNSQGMSKREMAFRYFSILNNDPQLPKKLLPKDWLGDKAHKRYLKELR